MEDGRWSSFLIVIKNKKRRPSRFNNLNERLIFTSGEEGIRTLARFNTSTPLARAPLQPLEYFSITDNTITDF